MVPLLFSEMGLKVVLSRVLSILVSWSDTFVGTTEDIPTITDGSVVTLVKLFMSVNPQAIEKQGGKVRTRLSWSLLISLKSVS